MLDADPYFSLNGFSPDRLEHNRLGYHFLSQSWWHTLVILIRFECFQVSKAFTDLFLQEHKCLSLYVPCWFLPDSCWMRVFSSKLGAPYPSFLRTKTRGLWTPPPVCSLLPHRASPVPVPILDCEGYFIGHQSPLSSITGKSFKSETLFSSSLHVLYQRPSCTVPGTLELINI